MRCAGRPAASGAGHGRCADVARPRFAVEIHQHRAAPVHLRARRRAADESRAQGRAVVDQRVQPFVRRHAVAEAGPADRILRQAPQRRGQAREQPEARQRHRHGHRERRQAAWRSDGSQRRDCLPGTSLRPGHQRQRDGGQGTAPGSAAPGPAGRRRTARTAKTRAGCAHRAAAMGLEGLEHQHAPAGRRRTVSRPMRNPYARQHQSADHQRQQQAQAGRPRLVPRQRPAAAVATSTAASQPGTSISKGSRAGAPRQAGTSGASALAEGLSHAGSNARARRQACRCSAPRPAGMRLPGSKSA